MATLQPPDDFRELDVVPRWEDVCTNRKAFVRPNIIDKCYPDADTYLDIQFRLLREDFYHPLRCGIRAVQSRQAFEDEDVRIYSNVKITEVEKKYGANMYELRFSTTAMEDVKWEETKQLTYGSLLSLTVDNFQSVIFFTVVDSHPKSLTKGIVTARCEDGDVPNTYKKRNCTMLESVAYFEAYRHVLRQLQQIPFDDFPLRDAILGNVQPREPRYLANVQQVVYDMSCISTCSSGSYSRVRIRFLQNFLKPEDLGLTSSQSKALLSAFMNQMTLIQGPPGTGKTFLVRKIVQVLLHNSRFWRTNNCPILVLSFSNAGLDQLLEKMLSFTNRIVRIGGRSKSEKLEPYLLSTLRQEWSSQTAYRRPRDKDICLMADIIGMTTTGAAKKKWLLDHLKSKIVIIEEAAMILEAHVVSALTSECQHLIMIGDHKQLKPSTAAHHLSDEPYYLNVSLFERLTKLGLKPSVLNVQHRMRPEVSRLIVPYIYPDLQNAPSVTKYPPVRGMQHSVFFLMHQQEETIHTDRRSRSNSYEVDMALALARYLLAQRYEPSQISILTTYSGQRAQFEASSQLHVQMTTVDNYQGQENDIIILSLVRSNEQQNVGFLRVENRICVGLSRAKRGFYMIGDMNALKKRSGFWNQVCQVLKVNGQLGAAFPLKCENQGHITKACKKSDFPEDGGCCSICERRMACGHICRKVCHAVDRDHRQQVCKERCLRACHMGHPCKKLCYESCDPCTISTHKTFGCGHAASLDCHRQINAVCQEPCPRKCPRDHRCPGTCGEPCRPCSVVVDKTLLCGHVIKVECHDESKAKVCMEPCTRTCSMGHLCSSVCYKPCPPCEIQVDKQLPCKHTKSTECSRNAATELCFAKVRKPLPCGHSEELECFRDPRTVVCFENCSRVCERGHPCPETCNEPCQPCGVLVNKKLPCDHTKMIGCSEDPGKEVCTVPCRRSCANGHPCPQKCTHQCDPCNTQMEKLLPCRHKKVMPCREDPENHHCKELVVKTLACGLHSAAIECGKSPGEIECPETCGLLLSCGHFCNLRCHPQQSHQEIPCRQPCLAKFFGRQMCDRLCSDPCNKLSMAFRLLTCSYSRANGSG